HISTYVNTFNRYTHRAVMNIQGVKATDFGKYICRASNVVSNTEKIFELDATGPPEKPNSVKVITAITTAVSLYIQWTPGYNNGKPQTFSVEYRKIKETLWTECRKNIPDPPPLPFKVHPLESNTSYVFRVNTWNAEGFSEYTEPSEIGTTWALPKSNEINPSFLKDGNNIIVTFNNYPINCTSITIYCCDPKVVTNCITKNVTDFGETPKEVVIEIEDEMKYTVAFHYYQRDDIIHQSQPQIAEQTIVGGVFGGLFLAALVAFIIAFLLRRRRFTRTTEKDGNRDQKLKEIEQNGPPAIGGSDNSAYETIERCDPHEERTYDTVPKENFEISSSQLKLEREIGKGEFGVVWKGQGKNIPMCDKVVDVAIKTLKDPSEKNKGDFLKELEVMKLLSHPNVVSLIACCTKKDPYYIVVEYMENGSVKDFLKKNRADGNKVYDNLHSGTKSLTSRQLLLFARDVANGMSCLESYKIIHRDLAARNILVDKELRAKVSDFG
ncbi:unnamed protein product, partial [Owenia fusiformis]